MFVLFGMSGSGTCCGSDSALNALVPPERKTIQIHHENLVVSWPWFRSSDPFSSSVMPKPKTSERGFFFFKKKNHQIGN